MATTKAAKVEVEIEKVKAKITEFQGKLRELEHKKTEIENTEIVDIVRGMSIPLDELATLLQAVKSGGALPDPTCGQNVHKSGPATDPADKEEDDDE